MASLASTDGRPVQFDQLPATQPRLTIVFAYVTLFVSLSIYGFWSAFVPVATPWLVLGQTGLLLALWGLTFVWTGLRPLRGFVVVSLAANTLGSIVYPLVKSSAVWIRLFGAGDAGYWLSNLGDLLLKLVSAGLMVGLLLALGLRRQDFFLVMGQLDAPLGRIRWIPGMPEHTSWLPFGQRFALTTFLIILTLLVLANLPRLSPDSLIKALAWLPAALLFAAMNAMYEEVVLRAASLSQLVNVVGPRHALLITVLSFGLGHFVGALPDGVTGVMLTAFFAYFMGKAMLETRGMGWPWLCHFAADAAVFLFLAVIGMGVGTA